EDAGDAILAHIGTPPQLLEAEAYNLHWMEPHELPIRVPDTNKGTYGKVLVIGGSRGKTGAAAMAGQAALRAGAGLVTVATAQSVHLIVAVLMFEFMTVRLSVTFEWTLVK